MKKTLTIFILILTLFSCNETIRESKALLKNQKGLEYLDQAQYDQAIKSFKEAIKIPNLSNDTKAMIYRNIAQTYYEMMELDSSITYSQLAADNYPKDSYEYLTNLADVKIFTGKTEEAIILLEQAVKLKPNELAANNSLGAIYLGEFGIEYFDPNKAIPFNLKAFEINNDRITEDVLGRNYIELENYEKARYHYLRLYKKYPDIEVIAYQLGAIEYLEGNKDKAEEYFKEVINKNPENKYAIDIFKENNK